MKRRSPTLTERIAALMAGGMTRQQALATIITEGRIAVSLRASERRVVAIRATESRRTRRGAP